MGLDAVLDEIDLDVSSFFEGCKDVMYYNDVCYLIPQDTNVIMLYYNPEIAKECGLDPENPPKTIEELDSWSDAMTVKAADGSYNRLGIPEMRHLSCRICLARILMIKQLEKWI